MHHRGSVITSYLTKCILSQGPMRSKYSYDNPFYPVGYRSSYCSYQNIIWERAPLVSCLYWCALSHLSNGAGIWCLSLYFALFMRHELAKTLVQWFHVETGTFHLSCRVYVVLPLDQLSLWASWWWASFWAFCTPVLGRPEGRWAPNLYQCLEENIPWTIDSDDVAFVLFFFYFINSRLLGNNWSMLTCKMLVAMRVVSIIEAYDWGSLSYGSFIAYLRQPSCQGFKGLEGYWQILTWWAYEYIPTMKPQYVGFSMTIYPRAYAWSLCDISRVVLI